MAVVCLRSACRVQWELLVALRDSLSADNQDTRLLAAGVSYREAKITSALVGCGDYIAPVDSCVAFICSAVFSVFTSICPERW